MPPAAPLHAPGAASDATSRDVTSLREPSGKGVPEELPLLDPLDPPDPPLLVDPLADPPLLPLPLPLPPPLPLLPLLLEESATSSPAPASDDSLLIAPPQATVHATPSPTQSDRPGVIHPRE